MLLLELTLLSYVLLSSTEATEVSVTKWSDDTYKYYTEVMDSIYHENSPHVKYTSFQVKTFFNEPPSITVKSQHVVKNQRFPISVAKQVFYWNDAFMNLTDVGKICEYRITSKDLHYLKETYFKDGSQPESLFYECSGMWSCDGLKCSPPNLGKWVLCASVVLMNCCVGWSIWYGVRKQREKKRLAEEELLRQIHEQAQNAVGIGPNVIYVVEGGTVKSIQMPPKRE